MAATRWQPAAVDPCQRARNKVFRVWPETIGRSIRVIEEAPFLTDEQKRDILFHNAARFLRLSDEQIAEMKSAEPPPSQEGEGGQVTPTPAP